MNPLLSFFTTDKEKIAKHQFPSDEEAKRVRTRALIGLGAAGAAGAGLGLHATKGAGPLIRTLGAIEGGTKVLGATAMGMIPNTYRLSKGKDPSYLQGAGAGALGGLVMGGVPKSGRHALLTSGLGALLGLGGTAVLGKSKSKKKTAGAGVGALIGGAIGGGLGAWGGGAHYSASKPRKELKGKSRDEVEAEKELDKVHTMHKELKRRGIKDPSAYFSSAKSRSTVGFDHGYGDDYYGRGSGFSHSHSEEYDNKPDLYSLPDAREAKANASKWNILKAALVGAGLGAGTGALIGAGSGGYRHRVKIADLTKVLKLK